MHWNYRVVKNYFGGEYGFREVYYDGNKIIGFTENMAKPSGLTPLEIANALMFMQKALKKPVLRETKAGNLVKDEKYAKVLKRNKRRKK